MYSKNDLISQLKEMGLKSTDNIMIHSSMKSIGDVKDGADTVVDAFMDYFNNGMVMMPTHTWKQMSEDYNIFDPNKEACCVGIIPNIFMHRDNVFRSLHPTHSIAAYGRNANIYIQGDENFTTPCNPQGCFGRLYDIDAKILLIGVTHAKNTYIHSIEESMNIKERFTEFPTTFYVKMPNNNLKKVSMYRHFNAKNAHISETFDKLKDYYYDKNAAKLVHFGDAECILCEARKLYELTAKILTDKPDYFIPYLSMK